MEKKFVPLSLEDSNADDPEEIKTWQEPCYQKVRQPPWLTTECPREPGRDDPKPKRKKKEKPDEELKRNLLKSYEKYKQAHKCVAKDVQVKCLSYDKYMQCVAIQRSPSEILRNILLREKIIKRKGEIYGKTLTAPYEETKLVKEKELLDIGETELAADPVKPKLASPTCSERVVFLQPQNLLELKTDKNAILLNEDKIEGDTTVPFSTYNPRLLQTRMDEKSRFDIIERDGNNYVKIDEDGNRTPCCCNVFSASAKQTEYEKCMQGTKETYEITDDIEVGFMPKVVLGTKRIDREEIILKDPIKDPFRPKEIAAIYTAFFKSYKEQIETWEADQIDEIIEDGLDLHEKSNEYYYEDKDIDFDILPEIEDEGMTLKITLLFDGYLNCPGHPNILKALKIFFKSSYSCLVWTGDVYLLIMKVGDQYITFDANGRDEFGYRGDESDDAAAVIFTNNIDHIVHLLLNCSDLFKSKQFKLYDIQLINFGIILDPIKPVYERKKKRTFVTVNSYYANIPGTRGLSPPEDDDDINPSIMIAYVTLMYACLDPPRHWNQFTIDALIKYGSTYYIRYVKENKIPFVNVRNLPDIIILGTYRFHVELNPFFTTGHLAPTRGYRSSPLTDAIQRFFNQYNSAIIQIDQNFLAVWRLPDMYYLFDPFQRSRTGVIDSDDEEGGTAILQMHLNIDSLCRILYRNALKMMCTGNFLIHPVIIKSINLIPCSKYYRPEHSGLWIEFPRDCTQQLGLEEKKGEEKAAAGTGAPAIDIKKKVPQTCLSILSVSPCERACSESEFLEQEKKKNAALKKMDKLAKPESLESLAAEEKFDDFDADDVVDPLVTSIFCSIMDKVSRKKRFQPAEKPPSTKGKRAEQVLLKSDLVHLKNLKLSLMQRKGREPCDEAHPGEVDKEKLTLKAELQIPTNLKALPDGSWIIHGTNKIEFEPEWLLPNTVIAAITSIVFSRKYSIGTWNPQIIDFVMDTVMNVREAFPKFQKTALPLVISKKFPKIKIGEKTLETKIIKIESDVACNLQYALDDALCKNPAVVVIFPMFCCAVFKRYNFLYLFNAHPCDLMGFCTSTGGNACFQRFLDLPSVTNRIHFNRLQADPQQPFVLLHVYVKNLTPEVFIKPSPSLEEMMYQEALDGENRIAELYKNKLAFINDEILKEKRRLKDFEKRKKKREKQRAKKLEGPKEAIAGEFEGLEEQPAEEEAEEEEEKMGEELGEEEEGAQIEKKQKPGAAPKKTRRAYKDQERHIEIGYHLREKNCLFKIQGSAVLESRAEASRETVKACYFAGIYAVLYAVLRPLNRWDYRRIDKVIEDGNELFNSIEDKTTECDRVVNNVQIDDFIFNLNVRVYKPLKMQKEPIELALEAIQKNKKYFLLQTTNTTFAIYKDVYFHLFDPYPPPDEAPVDVEGEGEEEEDDDAEPKRKCPKGIKKYPENGTASWILFPCAKTMLSYIEQTAESPEWKTIYNLYVVDINSFKKAPKKVQLVNFLIDSTTEEEKISEDIRCHTEKVAWLEISPSSVPWARTKTSNIFGAVRGTPLTKRKSWDVEIPNSVYSLWGSLHPLAPIFDKRRGKQYLAVNVMSCCMASIYRLSEWNRQVIDSIVVHGDKYFEKSSEFIDVKNYDFTLEDLDVSYEMENVTFNIHIEIVLTGVLYTIENGKFNLCLALTYFFKNYQYGVIQCCNKSLAFGRANKGFFMFDCQSNGMRLFPVEQGTAYVLHCLHLRKLLYCMVMTLNVPRHKKEFLIHKVDVTTGDDLGEGEDE